jgi:RNA polymerase sigma factor (sigma-70 family)
MPLCKKMAARYRRPEHFEDLVQEGVCGVLVALEKFDVELGNRFVTYAVWWIRERMGAYLAALPPATGMPEGNGEAPEGAGPLCDRDGRVQSWIEPYRDQLGEMLDSEQETAITVAMHKALNGLDARERKIVEAHDLEGESLRDIGATLGISGERVRQIHNRAIAHIRATTDNPFEGVA